MNVQELIARVRELDAAATPEPWEFDGRAGIRRISTHIWEYMSSEIAAEEPFPGRNVTLIAEYRTLAPKLADMLGVALLTLRELQQSPVALHVMVALGRIEAMAEGGES